MAYTHDIAKLLDIDAPVYEVAVDSAQGSTPREAGSWMLVSQTHSWGTIGGGRLENIAIEKVAELILGNSPTARIDLPLGPEIGQCCGGRVSLTLTKLDHPAKAAVKARVAAEISQRPHVYIFGAGHTGRALAQFCAMLPVRCIVVDSRSEELSLVSKSVEQRLSALPEAELSNAPANSAFVVMTHDHALDFLICSDALARQDAAYVGMVGSRTKRAKFLSWTQENLNGLSTDALHCPMAAHAKLDKRPEVLAAHIAAEIMSSFAQQT